MELSDEVKNCWKLFAVKSPIEIEQVEIITGDDRQNVDVWEVKIEKS